MNHKKEIVLIPYIVQFYSSFLAGLYMYAHPISSFVRLLTLKSDWRNTNQITVCRVSLAISHFRAWRFSSNCPLLALRLLLKRRREREILEPRWCTQLVADPFCTRSRRYRQRRDRDECAYNIHYIDAKGSLYLSAASSIDGQALWIFLSPKHTFSSMLTAILFLDLRLIKKRELCWKITTAWWAASRTFAVCMRPSMRMWM